MWGEEMSEEEGEEGTERLVKKGITSVLMKGMVVMKRRTEEEGGQGAFMRRRRGGCDLSHDGACRTGLGISDESISARFEGVVCVRFAAQKLHTRCIATSL